MTTFWRTAVFLLVLANLLFFAWTQGYFGKSVNPDTRRLEEQIFPERLRIVSPTPIVAKDESKALGKRHAESETCRQWTELANAEADQLERLLAQDFSSFRVSRKTSAEVNGYWVFMPPLPSREEANRKATELEQLGVQEFFVVTGGANQLAISLGTYRTEAAANTRLEALRAKGVKSARIGERKGKPVNSVEITGPEAQFEPLQQALGALLPKLGNARTCPTDNESRP